ncbi:MAG: M23 family metallopeptidase [Zoogloeaceae bacterium]|nr:M23 family metallopeptidase [Zoogloeaceae bacterium]
MSWLSIQGRWLVAQNLLHSIQRHEVRQAEKYVQGNLYALASKVGELQAQTTQLDILSQRLSKKTGVKPVGKADPQDPQGGPFVPVPPNEASLRQEIERLSRQIQEQSRFLSRIEDQVLQTSIQQTFLPTTLPVAGGARIGSPFGPRNDPFGRGQAIHEGLDFSAPYGTRILAAAGGIVVYAAYHPEFGNLVEISHGGELITRYAHMSELSVAVGDAVRRGEQVGLLGNTGRSTGPHLHFEVRKDDQAIDPAPFLSDTLARKMP